MPLCGDADCASLYGMSVAETFAYNSYHLYEIVTEPHSQSVFQPVTTFSGDAARTCLCSYMALEPILTSPLFEDEDGRYDPLLCFLTVGTTFFSGSGISGEAHYL